MYLDSDAHVMRKNEDTGRFETTVVRGGVLVDDTDLTDDEIDELTALRVVRPATGDEIDRLEQRDAEDARAELLRTQETEVAQLRAQHDTDRAALEATGPAPEASRSSPIARQTELTELQAKHAAALAKLDQA
jgi:hypothetical protein